MADSTHVKMEWSQITDFIIIGTNLCCTMHAQALYDQGLTAEIDVQLEHSEHLNLKLPIALWLPTKDNTPSTLDQLQTGANFLATQVQNKNLTYVHCHNGHGRAPSVVAAYFISTGLTPDQAIEKIASQRPEIHFESKQIEQLENFSRTL